MTPAPQTRTKITKRVEWAVSWRHDGCYCKPSDKSPCPGHFHEFGGRRGAAEGKVKYLTRPNNPGNLDVALVQRRVITTNWLPL
jgi:hypothetical protein